MAWESSEPETIVQPKEKVVPSILIAVPQRNQYTLDTFWTSMTIMQRPPKCDVVLDHGRPLDLTRNVFVSRFLHGNYDYLMFLDDDIIVELDTLAKLIHAGVPMVSAVYFARAPPHNPVASYQDMPVPKQELGGDELLEVDEVGMGCVLLHKSLIGILANGMGSWRCLTNHTVETGKRVFSCSYQEAKAANYECKYCHQLLLANFFDHTHGLSDSDEAMSEDYNFCKLVRDNGQKVCIKADCFVGHATTVVVTKDGYISKIKEGNRTK